MIRIKDWLKLIYNLLCYTRASTIFALTISTALNGLIMTLKLIILPSSSHSIISTHLHSFAIQAYRLVFGRLCHQLSSQTLEQSDYHHSILVCI